MYEVGKKRCDGKYNVWRRICIDDYWWEWIIVAIYDSLTEASEFAYEKNRRRNRPSYKVNQNV